MKYRTALRELVGVVVREGMNRKASVAHIASWIKQSIPPGDQQKFQEMAETELLGLHEGNFARYQITPREFAVWHQVWTAKDARQ